MDKVKLKVEVIMYENEQGRPRIEYNLEENDVTMNKILSEQSHIL